MTHSKTMTALLSLILLLSVTGCAKTRTIYKTQTFYRYPPTILTEPCPVPEYTGTQWGDLPLYAARLQAALRLCDEDKRLIRQWKAEHDK